MPDLKPGKSKWLEWGLIVFAIWVYCLPFLDLGRLSNLPGPEAQYFQTFDQILEFSLKEQGQFPLWNPYYFTGIPYIAHPMLHVYNPFVSLPVMILGTQDGFKLAVFFGFLIAGLGMWWLGKELGLTPAGRIWISLMYAFCGVPAAKFIQGQYLMVLGFGWIPFSLAAILAATRCKRWTQICVAAAALALLFFCGNHYYAYYMLYVIALFAILTTVKLEKNLERPPSNFKGFYRLGLTWGLSFCLLLFTGLVFLYLTGNLYYSYYLLLAAVLIALIRAARHENSPVRLKIDREQFQVLVAIGVLALGLIAVQLLPSLDYRNRYIKDINIGLTDSRNLETVLLDFVSPEPFRPDAYSNQLRPEEFFAYIGWWPLIGMTFLPLAWNKQNRSWIVLLLSLVVFTFAWIDVKDMPWKNLFQTVPFLYQFRYPSRMVVIGAMALVTAGGLGLDFLWGQAQKLRNTEPAEIHRRFAGNMLILALGTFSLWSIGDLAYTSRPLLQTSQPDEVQNKVIEWMRNHDSGIYYVNAPNKWDQAIIGNQMRYQNGGYAITYLPSFKNQISDQKIVAEPKYAIVTDGIIPSNEAVPVVLFTNASIYKNPNNLPFAFTMDATILTTPSDSNLDTREVTPETFLARNINSYSGTISSDSSKALILLSTFTPNWQLSIDGKPTKIYSAYGYLAAEVNPGTHHYLFVYRPIWFYVGLMISLVTLVAVAILITGDRAGTIPFRSH